MSRLPYVPPFRDSLGVFIGELRDRLGYSQERIAAYFHLDRSRISRYESNKSKPKMGYVAALAQLFTQETINEPEVQQTLLREVNRAIDHRYRHRNRFPDWTALGQIADTYLAEQQLKANERPQPPGKKQTQESWETQLEKRFGLVPAVQLVGSKNHLNHLSEQVFSPNAPWVVCISGLGGIGKTTLANTLIRQTKTLERFYDVAWVSAKQHEYSLGLGIEEIAKPVLNTETLINTLLQQLDPAFPLSQPPAQKTAALIDLLKAAAYLIVIDNLETLADYQTLLPTLRKLANPTKFLLTSRHSLQTQPHIFCLCLEELDQDDTMDLIRQEAQDRGINDVVNAPDSQLHPIYEVVGGNPLALKLVVGQMSVLSLPRVLNNLKQAQGKNIDDLYTYIYWQAWHMLDAAGQQIFLLMPLANHGTVDQLSHLTKLEPDDLHPILQQLARLSLVQIGGSLIERRYTLHRLTETFLLNEAIEWKTST